MAATRHLFGLELLDAPRIDVVVDALIDDRPTSPGWRCVVTPNVDHLVRYEREPEERATARSATLLLPDGTPLVWASRLLGQPLTARLTGADLFDGLWPRLVADEVPVVVVASSDAVAGRLDQQHPHVSSIVAPMFDVGDRAAIEKIAESVDTAVREIGARFVVVGVSMPKHHRIANALQARWSDDLPSSAPTVLLLGQAPEFTLGLARRAPLWMQRTGTEWLYRLVREPRRMARRYLIDDPRFFALVWREWRRATRSSRRR